MVRLPRERKEKNAAKRPRRSCFHWTVMILVAGGGQDLTSSYTAAPSVTSFPSEEAKCACRVVSTARRGGVAAWHVADGMTKPNTPSTAFKLDSEPRCSMRSSCQQATRAPYNSFASGIFCVMKGEGGVSQKVANAPGGGKGRSR